MSNTHSDVKVDPGEPCSQEITPCNLSDFSCQVKFPSLMASIGHIEEFAPGQHDWQQWKERLSHYLDANDIVDPKKQRAVFLSVCGAATYSVIRSLVQPKTPVDYTFKELVAKVSEHYNPKPSVIVKRFKFYKRDQLATETLSEYLAQLRSMSEFCEFNDSLNDMIRDRFVCGISDSAIQKRLLAETNLTLENAISIALASESATRNVVDLQSSASNRPNDVNLMSHAKFNNGKKSYTRDVTKHNKNNTSQNQRKPQRGNKQVNYLDPVSSASHASSASTVHTEFTKGPSFDVTHHDSESSDEFDYGNF